LIQAEWDKTSQQFPGVDLDFGGALDDIEESLDAMFGLFLMGLGLMAVILMASWHPLLESVRIREYVGAVGDFQLPVWPVRLVTLLGLLATALCFLLLALMDVRRLVARRSHA
jgi:hypothetical protein